MQNKERKLNFSPLDLAAILIGLALFAFYLITAHNGVGVHDEAGYYCFAQRFLAGDRFLADEWHLSQMSLLIDMLPLFLYTKLVGSTRGVILFFRYLYIVVDAVFYCHAYRKLRRYGAWGLFAAAAFCILLPGALTGFDYHSLSCMAVLHALLILCFANKTPGAAKLLLAGVLIAVGVLAQPFLIFVYAFYAVAVLLLRILKKRPESAECAFVFRLRTFGFITLGAVFVFLAFMLLLWARGSLAALPGVLPYLLNGKEYNLSEMLNVSSQLDRVRVYGVFHLAGLAVCAGAAGLRVFSKKEPSAPLKIAVFAASVLFFFGACVTAAVNSFTNPLTSDFFKVLISHELPFLLFSPVPCLLCRKAGFRFHALWVVGLLFSLAVDLSSRTYLAAGGRISAAAAFLGCGQLIGELKEELRSAEKRGAFRSAAAVTAAAAVVTLLWVDGYAAVAGTYEPIEYIASGAKAYRCDETITAGPWAGLHTTPRIRQLYDASLTDLNDVRAMAGDGPVLVYGCSPYMYLYLETTYASYSAYYLDEPERLLDYWRLFPERRPAAIYVPMFDYDFTLIHNTRQRAEEIRRYFTGAKIVNGSAGYLIEVTGDFIPPEE